MKKRDDWAKKRGKTREGGPRKYTAQMMPKNKLKGMLLKERESREKSKPSRRPMPEISNLQDPNTDGLWLVQTRRTIRGSA